MTDVMRAIAAATSVAASLDLPANDAIVLHNSNKLALRLTPCDVFARVAPVGQEVARFEVDLAQRLIEAGCPVRSRAEVEGFFDGLVLEDPGLTDISAWAREGRTAAEQSTGMCEYGGVGRVQR
ncbi:SAM-dependent methyltransferase [Streptomyces pulveraceus]|uniref:SAM-dependent methyltransferase n=1 Tax=Streptomyces pulveraceus TaxID=68258 RepID=A0ABW1GK55_9ACTN